MLFKIMAISLLLAVLLVLLVDSADGASRGLHSVADFCEGTGELDDLRDLTVDVYKKQTG